MFNKVLIICLIALLSACDTKPKQVDTPKIVDTPKFDKNDICFILNNQFNEAYGIEEGEYENVLDDFRARLGATKDMDYSKRMDIGLEYGFRASEFAKIEDAIKRWGVYSNLFELTMSNTCAGL